MSNPVKDVAQNAIKAVVVVVIEEASRVISEYVKEYIETVYKNIKERNRKYEEIRQLYLLTDLTFEDFQKGIIETEKIITLLKSDLDLLNKKNPLKYVQYQFLYKEFEKWQSLSTTLNIGIIRRIQQEVHSSYYSKQSSSFFEKYPEINAQILACKSVQNIEDLLTEIRRYYTEYPKL